MVTDNMRTTTTTTIIKENKMNNLSNMIAVLTAALAVEQSKIAAFGPQIADLEAKMAEPKTKARSFMRAIEDIKASDDYKAWERLVEELKAIPKTTPISAEYQLTEGEVNAADQRFRAKLNAAEKALAPFVAEMKPHEKSLAVIEASIAKVEAVIAGLEAQLEVKSMALADEVAFAKRKAQVANDAKSRSGSCLRKAIETNRTKQDIRADRKVKSTQWLLDQVGKTKRLRQARLANKTTPVNPHFTMTEKSIDSCLALAAEQPIEPLMAAVGGDSLDLLLDMPRQGFDESPSQHMERVIRNIKNPNVCYMSAIGEPSSFSESSGGTVPSPSQNLSELKVVQLRLKAQGLGIKGTSRLKKDELIQAIIKAETDAIANMPKPAPEPETQVLPEGAMDVTPPTIQTAVGKQSGKVLTRRTHDPKQLAANIAKAIEEFGARNNASSELVERAKEIALKWEAKKFLKVGQSWVDQVVDSVKSAAASAYGLTLQAYPTSEKTATLGGNHMRLSKLALVPTHNWRHGASFLWSQWVLYNAINGIKVADLAYDDFLFVEMKKDSRGREVSTPEITAALSSLNYCAVTPGFWVKRSHPYANWVRQVFVDNNTVRGRASSMANAPYKCPLAYNKLSDGTLETIPVFVADLTAFGHEGLDGSNIMSRNLRCLWDGAIGQVRLHSKLGASIDGVSVGWQGKGLIRRHEAWVVKLEDGSYTLTFDKETEGAIRAIILHYDNVKGRSSKKIERLVAGGRNVINLNAYGTKGEHEWCFGGIIVEDYEGLSTTSWQNSNLYSPKVLEAHNEFLLSLVDKMFKRLSSMQNIEHLTMLQGDNQLQTLIAAQQGVNQGAVDAMVFGLNQKWPTHYCEQMNLPAGWAVVGDQVGRDKAKGDKVDELTVTGQPQLYHQCIVTVKAMQWRDIDQVAKFVKAILRGANSDTLVRMIDTDESVSDRSLVDDRVIQADDAVSQRQGEFLAAWIKHIKADDTSLSDVACVTRVDEMLTWLCGSFVGGAQTLIWMSTIDQATMQRDSDGDRLLVTASKQMLALAKAHIEAIKDLPKPHLEVKKGGDADGKGTPLESVAGAEWCAPAATPAQIAVANNYLCAPNKGQGPVGLLVNAAAGLLIHIVWKDENNQWAPDSKTRNWALKLYAFICLLIQNAIDRQKKVHKVPALKSWRSLDLYSGDVADYEALPPGQEHYFFATGEPGAMSLLRLTAREVPAYGNLGGYANMMNARIIKHWVTFGINLVNSQSPLLDDPRLDETELSKQIAEAIVAAGNSETVATPWANLKTILHSPLSEDELSKLWVAADDLYAFKKQASLHHKIAVASPGVKHLSNMVVDKYNEWRKARNVQGYGRAQLFVALSAHLVKEANKKQVASLKTGILRDPAGAMTTLARLMDVQTKSELSKMNQSEVMQSRKSDDPREVLSVMRGALRNNGLYNPFLRELDKVLNGSLKKDVVASVQGLANATMVIWHSNWIGSMATHDPEETLAALVMLGRVDSKTDLASDLSKDYQDDQAMDMVDLAKTLVDKSKWTKDKWVEFCDAVGKGERYQGAPIFKQRAEVDNPLDSVLGEWLPAILLATENADRKVEQNNFVHNTKGFIDAMKSVASQEMNVNEFMASAKGLLQDFVNGMARGASSATLETIPEQFKALWIVFNAVVSKDNPGSYTSCLLGFASKAGLVLPGYKVAELFGPLVGAYRVGTWVRKTVELSAVNGSTHEEKLANRLKMIQDALFTSSTRYDREAGVPYTVTTLNPRPLVTVPWHIRFGFTSALLDHGYSHYMLAGNQKLSTWTEETNGKSVEKMAVGQADRWIYMDALMHQAKSLIPGYTDALASGMNWGVWYGDIMAPGHVSFMFDQFTKLASDPKVMADAPRLANIQERLKALKFQWDLIQNGHYSLLSGENDGTLKARLYGQVAAPIWFGGNDKTLNTQFSGCRSSAYRPLWRFLLSVLGDAEYSVSAAIFDQLAGTQTATNSRGQDAKAVADGQTLAGLEGGNNSGATASVRQSYYRDPDHTPGCGFHNQEWVKIPKSPMQEPLGSVVGLKAVAGSFSFTHDLLAQRGFRTDADGSRTVLDNASILDLRDEVIFAWRNVGIFEQGMPFSKINGMNTPNAVAKRIMELDFTKVTNLAATQTKQSFANARAEGVIGCWGATSGFDSFVLSKLNDEDSLARFANKTSVYWREFGQLLTTKTKLTYRAADPALVYKALFAFNQHELDQKKLLAAEAELAQESDDVDDIIKNFLKESGN